MHSQPRKACGQGTGTGDGCESIYGNPFPDEIHPRLKFRRADLSNARRIYVDVLPGTAECWVLLVLVVGQRPMARLPQCSLAGGSFSARLAR